MRSPSKPLGAPATPRPGPYRIQVVARLTDVPAATLRAWERRYGIPTPARTASAYRLYSDHDVAAVRAMRELCSAGMATADAAKAVLARGGNDSPDSPDLSDQPREPNAPAVESNVADAGGSATAARSGDARAGSYALTVERVIRAVQHFDADAIDVELTRAALMTSAETLYERIVRPLLVRLGDMWDEGSLSIAQEHFASERLEFTVRGLLRLVQPVSPRRVVLIACFSHEDHIFGALGAALWFATRGFRVELLGARTPPSALSDAARGINPDLIGLSVTVAPPPGTARAMLTEYADAARDIPWVIGGRGAPEIADLAEACGGFVAHGPAGEWQKDARSWLKRSAAKRGSAGE